MFRSEDIVWIPDEQVVGLIVGGLGAFVTTIAYIKDDMEFEVLMENNEFEIVEDVLSDRNQ